jgi:hypothetical protein
MHVFIWWTFDVKRQRKHLMYWNVVSNLQYSSHIHLCIFIFLGTHLCMNFNFNFLKPKKKICKCIICILRPMWMIPLIDFSWPNIINTRHIIGDLIAFLRSTLNFYNSVICITWFFFSNLGLPHSHSFLFCSLPLGL